jgi:hypothetical protein
MHEARQGAWRTYSAPRCIEEGCEKQAQGGMKARCMRHAREHGEPIVHLVA